MAQAQRKFDADASTVSDAAYRTFLTLPLTVVTPVTAVPGIGPATATALAATPDHITSAVQLCGKFMMLGCSRPAFYDWLSGVSHAGVGHRTGAAIAVAEKVATFVPVHTYVGAAEAAEEAAGARG
jgi:hypothetical protein